ncbi:MAG: hypothetical protein HOB63_01895 [Opitutae bacterium]|nr:hypothetical protein [Opitutae bacterium]
MKPYVYSCPRFAIKSLCLLLVAESFCAEREVTPEQQAAVAGTDEKIPDARPQRPTHLPDLTKGEPLPKIKGKTRKPWTLGPTGIVGIMVGGFGGDQIQVQGTRVGSPAHGKLLRGDVLIGLNGRKFVAGEHLGYRIGNAIIEAEKEENLGKLSFQVWRDRNYIARTQAQNMAAIDIDELFKEAKEDDSLYEIKSDKQQEVEAKNQGYEKFPLDPTSMQVDLTLREMPPYSDTSPYDCPKSKQILEDAWKVLEAKFVYDPKRPRSGRGGILEAMALVASGKKEHRELVRKWVRGKHSPWHPPKEPIGAMFEPGYKGYKGYQSWHKGFIGLNCALYFDATGDDYVLPLLKKHAIETAMGQSSGGSWGHTFAFPRFNGGKLHGMNPGYGALNAAGNRCFFLITLARELGIEHPEIDAAIERAHKFFGSYVDLGAIPYGDFAAYPTDDSNGKNTGIAFSMNLLGDKYGAKYFAMMSSHCSFSRRGGHGHDYHGNWSFWAANLCGPKVRAYGERNMRWRRTLCRQHDGSFAYNSPTGYGPLRDPTATAVITYSAPLEQTLITGKNPDADLYPNDREMKQLLSSARGQMNDSLLMELDGTPWRERSTKELFELLDIFKPKARGQVASELGKRYLGGEAIIGKELLDLLGHEAPRYRDGALRGLQECGKELSLQNLSKIISLLEDPQDFVRISAIRLIDRTCETKETQQALLEASIAPVRALPPNSVRNTLQKPLFAKDSDLANTPFRSGFDEELVRQALEGLIELDPVGPRGFMLSRAPVWKEETILKVAGSLVFAAEEEQVVDQMFINRSVPAQKVLIENGYREGYLATAHRLRKKVVIPRDIRPFVGFKRPLVDMDAIQSRPGLFKETIKDLKIWLTDEPLATVMKKIGKKKIIMEVDDLLSLIEKAKPMELPSIADLVDRALRMELQKAGDFRQEIALCRKELEDPDRNNLFRKITAMNHLAEVLEADAIKDLIPYLDHPRMRLFRHARQLVVRLAPGAGLENLHASYPGETIQQRRGIIHVLGLIGSRKSLPLIREALENENPTVRREAILSLSKIEGTKCLPEILIKLGETSHKEDFRGCELALLAHREDPEAVAMILDRCVTMLPKSEGRSKHVLYWVLAQLGDEKVMKVLEEEGRTIENEKDLVEFAHAISYSRHGQVNGILLRLAEIDATRAKIIAPHSVRRMVLGPNGYGDVTDKQKLDYAEKILKLSPAPSLIQYLGKVHHVRSIGILLTYLKKGQIEAAESLIRSAEGLENLDPDEGRLAFQGLKEVIEYIEVVHLRGGPTAHMNVRDRYVEWKKLQTRAGKAVLKVGKPKAKPQVDFDDLDLDI